MTALLRGTFDVLAPAHLIALLALGLLGQPARFPLLPLLALAAGLLSGSLAIAFGISETPAATVLLVLAALAATAVIAAWIPPQWITAPLAVAIGAALALNAPPHAITIAGAVAAQVGFAIAVLVVFSVVAFIALYATRPWQRVGLRVLGSWIAASAILVLALKLVR